MFSPKMKRMKLAPSPPEGAMFKSPARAVQPDRYMVWWNRLSPPFKHHDHRSATYLRAVKYFKELEEGTFWKKKPADKRWAATHEVEFDRQWEEREILVGLRRLIRAYKYLDTRGKYKLPKSLDKLLYNYNTKKSMFFTAYVMEYDSPKAEPTTTGQVMAENFRI